MAYTFDQIFAVDEANPANVAQNTSVLIFAPGDATKAPLTLTTTDGSPLANPVPVNANGFGDAFMHATLDRVAWEGGGFTGFFTSYEGMKNEAIAARSAAETAAVEAATSASLVGAPADTVVEMLINNPASATAIALGGDFAKKTTETLGPVTALSLPGSKRTGNLRGGSVNVTASGAGHNAFPGLTLCDDGTLLAVWRSAGQHDPGPVLGVIKARRYGTDLQPLGAEFTVLTDPLDLRDPMLTKLADGRILMQYFKHDGTANTIAGVWVAVSSDNGATFTPLSKVPFTWDTLAACAGRVIVAPNGDWLVSAYGRTSATFQHIRLMRSTDGGQTWTGEVTVAEGQAESRNYMEPVIGTLPDGTTLMCLIRVADSTGANPAIYRTTSTDSGATWAAETSVITGDGGRPAWIRLKSGGLLAITRDQSAAPYPVRVRTSWDNGLTWTAPTQLGATPTNQGTYAQPVEIAPGLVAAARAIEASATSSTVTLGYLADGYGYSPAGDDFADPDGTLFKGAGEAGLVGGAPTFGQVLGWPAWTLSATGSDQIGFTFRIPASWKKFDIAMLWVNTAGGAVADVVFRHDHEQANPAATLTAAAGGTATVTIGNQFILTETPMATGVARTGEFLRVKPTRLGADAADTYTNTVSVIGVRVRRVE